MLRPAILYSTDLYTHIKIIQTNSWLKFEKSIFLESLHFMNFTMEKVAEYLSQHGIKPSLQRIKIYEYLYSNHNHPTVDMIYNDLAPKIPTLSRTTVYNTLKLFVSQGVAFVVNIEDNEVRYDADTSIHGHFKCKGCGQVFDFMVDADKMHFAGLDQFQITEHHVYLKGLCKVCKTRSN